MKTTLTVVQRSGLLLAAALLVPTLAHAHPGVGSSLGFSAGLAHPFSGLDHLCAMIAVGLWAAQMGGRATWSVPLTFVSVMALGGFLGMAGVHLPLVETGIALSVLTLGVFIVAAARLPLVASMILVGLFALCHGHAHGAEMPAMASGLLYGAGFVAATVALHALGLGLGVAIQRVSQPNFVRATGAAIAVCGLALLVG